MFHKHIQPFRRVLLLLPLGIVAVVTSFNLGTQTADIVRTIGTSSATDTLRGDITLDGIVDSRDVVLILEIAQGYRPATPAELRADPNENGILTVDDALRILRELSPSHP